MNEELWEVIKSTSERFANEYLDLALEWSQENPEKAKMLLDFFAFNLERFIYCEYRIDRVLLELKSQSVLKNGVFAYNIDGERQFIFPLDISVEVHESAINIIEEDGIIEEDVSRRWAIHNKMRVNIVWLSSVEFDINPDNGPAKVLDAFFDALTERMLAQMSASSGVIVPIDDTHFVKVIIPVDDIYFVNNVIVTK